MSNKFVKKPWRPTAPVSNGATAYHDAVINASWHKRNIGELIKIIDIYIKDGHTIVDFGAGTGGSAIYLLKRVKKNINLLLVDNSASWLTKAYHELSAYSNTSFSLLEKIGGRYAMLHETIGREIADHVFSANTVHLIPKLEEVFLSIHRTLKPGGTFVLQSGNISRNNRRKGILMIDNTINSVHDIALGVIRTDNNFKKYRKGLNKKIEKEKAQRKIVFPDPLSIDYYLKVLNTAGFINTEVTYKHIRVAYKDWLAFLRVKRLQSGILPEIGGREAAIDEEKDRNKLIAIASSKLFKKLAKQNQFANGTSFTAEWIYIKSEK